MSTPFLARRSLVIPLALAGCWFVWMTVGGVAWALKAPGKLDYILRSSSADGIIGFVFCGLLFLVYERLRERLAFALFIGLAPALCFLFGAAWHAADMWLMWRLGWNDRLYLSAQNLAIGGGLMDGLTLGLFSLLFLAVDHGLRLSAQQEKAREATALAHQAQLQMLRYQLNPHFLFNALNSIRAMIVENPDSARQIVTELAEFLRYSLDGRGHESTIEGEVRAIESYLAIQRIRFEERLDVSMQVDPAARDIVVPCFLIHPLVENAVKHGMETSPLPLRLEIAIESRGDDLSIRVSNSGRLLRAQNDSAGQPRNGTGTGLKNVRQRLELAFPDRHQFDLTERDGRVHAEILLREVARADPP